MEQNRQYGRSSYQSNGCGCQNNQRQNQNRNQMMQQMNRGMRQNMRPNMMPCSNSKCGDSDSRISDMPLGMCYVPMQEWGDMYDPEMAVCQGTAFPDLNLIFCGVRGNRR